MRLTIYTDYTLRVLMYVGLKGNQRSTIREISDCYGISKNHLMKIVQDLGHEGVLETIRGKNGGLKLARPAEDICLGDIVRMTEPDLQIVECFASGPASCRLQGSCILSTALSEALEAFLEVLDSYTLADLIRPKRKLRQLLELTDLSA